MFRELAESNASASALDEHQQLEAAHRNQLVSQHFDQVMEDDDFLELGSPQPLFQAGTSQVAQGGASVKEEEEEEEDVNVKEEDLEEDCGDEEEKAATLTKWATFKTKKYRWSKRSGNAAMKHVKRVKGQHCLLANNYWASQKIHFRGACEDGPGSQSRRDLWQ